MRPPLHPDVVSVPRGEGTLSTLHWTISAIDGNATITQRVHFDTFYQGQRPSQLLESKLFITKH